MKITPLTDDTNFVLCFRYRSDVIRNYFLNYETEIVILRPASVLWYDEDSHLSRRNRMTSYVVASPTVRAGPALRSQRRAYTRSFFHLRPRRLWLEIDRTVHMTPVSWYRSVLSESPADAFATTLALLEYYQRFVR